MMVRPNPDVKITLVLKIRDNMHEGDWKDVTNTSPMHLPIEIKGLTPFKIYHFRYRKVE